MKRCLVQRICLVFPTHLGSKISRSTASPCFRSRKKSDRSDWDIVPDKYVNDLLIRENWDAFLRLIATIKLKETTASDIFRRLNAYSKQHSLYQTLKAFGQITKSRFILRYIDDLALRQAIEKQLNKVELANQFTRAVAVGNPRELTQAEKEEQEIAESCNRLIKNCIICWNYLYLTHKLARTTDTHEAGRISCTSLPPTHRLHGRISTCWANTISPMRSARIPSVFYP